MFHSVGSSELEKIPVTGIAVTLALGMLLALWPLPVDYKWLRPEFSVLLVFYWINRLPFRLGLVFAWCVGLLFDLVSTEIIGQKALALTVVAYLLVIFNSHVKRAGIVGETVFVFLSMLVYLLLVFWINAMTGKFHWNLQLVVPALATALCWPMFGRLLSRFYG